MFIPIHDDNPLKVISFQRVTVGLIIANVLTFLWQTSLAPGEMIAADQAFGVVPAALVGGLPDFGAFPEELALLTYMFLQALQGGGDEEGGYGHHHGTSKKFKDRKSVV